ncbi:MAG: hypothetical protein N2593_01890, partial [Patescibacteria group bacterium]|nr:hypothetical protein [Patescibacteria group bacterium]
MKNSLIDLFIQICQIDSPTGKEKQMADFVLNFAKKYGFFAKKDNFGNVYIKAGENPKIFL